MATLNRYASAEELIAQHGESELPTDRDRRPRSVPISIPNAMGYKFSGLVTSQEPQANRVQPTPSGDQTVETDFAELGDGTLVDLVQVSENPRVTLLAVWKDGQLRLKDQVEYGGQILVPLQETRKKNDIFRQLGLPGQPIPYKSTQILLSRIEHLISRCVSVNPSHIPVLADFVLSTWLVDRFFVAPYLSVVGLPQSGKTTLLKVLSLVCRRSLLTADISTASLYRACAEFMPTILIDEAGSVKNNPALRHMLRAGSTRDVTSVQANQTFHAYGAKVISWLEPPDDAALNSRCVLISMCETTRTDLARPSDIEIMQEAATLQAQLLQFRFENYRNVKPGPVPGDEMLRPRSRDLLRVLTAAHPDDAERSQRLLKFFNSGQAVPLEPLGPEENAVLRVLYSTIHMRKDFVSVQISNLTAAVNQFLERAGESLCLQPRKVGAVLTSLGFSNRRRANSGWVVSLNREDAEKLHHLAENYGIENLEKRFRETGSEDCDFCKAAAARKINPDPEIPQGCILTSLDLREELER